MTKQFILSSPALVGNLLFEFNEDGTLKQFTNATSKPLNKAQQDELSRNFPTTLQKLEFMCGSSNSLTMKPVVASYDFDTFWDTYGYKVGNKGRAKKLFESLEKVDKVKVLEGIPGYRFYLQTRPNLEQLYPETFLAQRRFDTDYKALAKAK